MSFFLIVLGYFLIMIAIHIAILHKEGERKRILNEILYYYLLNSQRYKKENSFIDLILDLCIEKKAQPRKYFKVFPRQLWDETVTNISKLQKHINHEYEVQN